ncbi:single-stranded DNA-binding protein [Legionella feeleii]|uniref:Single-stranded DNA-binding protein n=1 Tax=Legionella feeleii TaxID=453 RepID=A0A0W0U4V5_9GAMM|nr:single-stranded DNA-binding protein [Legionella feeleii]KTD02653.1 Single-strand binding protein (SSB) (Helix-destabilizing protein) [Legionella feeleii]SPX61209.1 Single-strand binding protein (SSB) (Helix-destabilizing protein) [Legionella feeleii]
MINEATLIGRVGKKDVRPLKNGTDMATIYLATSKHWIDKSGEKQEQTVWHNVNFFDKLADIVNKYAHVGNLVYIKGEINHKQIKEGEKAGQWAYSITANQIKILPSGAKKDASESCDQSYN